jgi:flagellar hook protein FlgE
MRRAPTTPAVPRASRRRAVLLPALACLLVACGGGDGGDDADVAEPLVAHPGRAAVQQTDRALDVAIFGDGMFAFIDAQGRTVYSRTAHLGLDRRNRLVNTDGDWLAGEPEGTTTPGQPRALAAVPMTSPARATRTVAMRLNLQACAPDAAETATPALMEPPPARQFQQGASGLNPILVAMPVKPGRACMLDTTPFVPGWNSGAAYATHVPIYDADGRERGLSLYFRDMVGKAWEVYATIDGVQVGPPNGDGQLVGVLRFDPATGQLDPATVRWTIEWPAPAPGSASGSSRLELDLGGSTQSAGRFDTQDFARDGHPTGRLQLIFINGDDPIRLMYHNGQESTHGRLLLAQFSVADRLRAVGQVGWLCEQQCAGARFAAPGALLTGYPTYGHLEPTLR